MADPRSNPEFTALPPPERKATYVRMMFSRIAQRYDFMNRLMTLGRDRAWRCYVVEQAVCPTPASPVPGENGDALPRVLDVATGTGDLALETLRQQPDARVVGLDFTPEMLALAQQKAFRLRSEKTMGDIGNPAFTAGDALRLPFIDGTFDAVVTAFALRNVVDIPHAFVEMARVTRPGGRVACLEIAKPRSRLFSVFFSFYFYRLVPMLGRWITGEKQAYAYLPHSLTAFLTPDEIATVMRHSGWHTVRYRRMMLGTVAVHVGIREPNSGEGGQ